MSTVLTVESVSKRYRIQRNRPITVKESIIQRLTGRHNTANTFWALRDIHFSLERGTVLGIIGHNGAGKSTLLRLICGLGMPTTGRIRRVGHVSGLLELGGGFHPDMTGRENLFTGGVLSGLTKRQVMAKQAEIIAFAELEEFIDQPVRTYSSGMYLRLAFATAIHFEPDIMVIDEVLAVGDSRFQKRCLERLAAFRNSGKTTVLTSHDTAQIQSMCDEVLVLEEGRVAMHGEPKSTIQCYNDLMRQRTEKRAAQISGVTDRDNLTVEQGSRMGTQEVSIRGICLYDKKGNTVQSLYSGDSLKIILEYSLNNPVTDFALTLGIYSEADIKCFESCITSVNTTFGSVNKRDSITCFISELHLLPGLYYINAGIYPTDWNYVYDYHWQMHSLHIEGKNVQSSGVSGVVSVHPVWSTLK